MNILSTELQEPVSERVKKFLQVEGDYSVFELTSRLRNYRNEFHPDKYQDENQKQRAEARFKDAQNLLKELQDYIEVGRFERGSTELAHYSPLYESEKAHGDLDRLRAELDDMRKRLEEREQQNSSLRSQLNEKKDKELRAEIEYLQALYKPSAKRYASFGFVAVLSVALAGISQVEKVSETLQRYSPFDPASFRAALFAVFILILGAAFKRMWEGSYINRKSEEVCSPIAADEFMTMLKASNPEGRSVSEFTEADVFNFIFGRKSILKSVLTSVGFSVFRRDTANRIKDIFLHNLLNKRLIDFSRAEHMQRYFRITKAKDDSLYWYEAYLAERKKNEDAAS